MSLDELVTINISASTATPTKPGFGTILIAAQKVPAGFTSRARTFASLTEMTDFGFAVSDPAYLCAQKMKAQNPAITNFKIGKRLLPCTHTVKLKCNSAVVGDTYAATINDQAVSYTVASGSSASASTVFAEVGVTGDTISRASGSFITDGHKPGMLLSSVSALNTWSGALIVSVSALTITLDSQDVVVETAAAVLTSVHTTSSLATYLETLTEALTGVTSSATTDTITLTHASGAGYLLDVKEWSTNFELSDTTADPGLATDLAAIKAFDNNWYGLALDSNSEAEIEVAALFVETEKKLFVPNSSDYGCEDAGVTNDVMSDIQDAAYARTGVLYSRSRLLSYSGAAWMAKQFTQNPGSDTWMFKTLASVTVDTLSASGRAAILAKNGNCYTATSGVNMTEEGKSGAGEYFDITRFVDWLRAEIQFRVFSALVNNSKIPFTDAGIDLIQSIIMGALKFGVERGGLVKGTLSCSFPLVADIDSATKATRRLSDGVFAGTLAGAIHGLDISGRLTA